MAGDKLLATHQYGGTGWLHTVAPVSMHNNRGLGHSRDRAEAKKRARLDAAPAEARAVTTPSDAKTGARESLRIVMGGHADHGFVGYRLMTAINATTPHAAVLVTSGQKNGLHGPMQYNSDIATEWTDMRDAARGADVIHCHTDYCLRLRLGNRTSPVVIHHHGSMYRKNVRNRNAEDRHRADVRLVSNLELLKYDTNLTWLPNPMPVALYRRVRDMMTIDSTKFRIAHSPSRRDYKGTEPFLAACKALIAKGLPIEPVLIEKTAHPDAIRIKATCHAVFDSFWLGIQCSGLEGAAMGLPVIAGDPYVRDQYQRHVGHVPYTYANDQAELEAALERLVTDPDFRETEAARVSTYCERFHDEAAVALRYLDILDQHLHWRTAMQRARRAW
jgi:hypothetical protein